MVYFNERKYYERLMTSNAAGINLLERYKYIFLGYYVLITKAAIKNFGLLPNSEGAPLDIKNLGLKHSFCTMVS
jgi:hypothetical protein